MQGLGIAGHLSKVQALLMPETSSVSIVYCEVTPE